MNRLAQSRIQPRALAAARARPGRERLRAGRRDRPRRRSKRLRRRQESGDRQRAQRQGPRLGDERPSFVVHPDRRPDARPALRAFTPVSGVTLQAMPNTLELIAEKRRHLQPLLRPLPALLPLARQPADRPLRAQPPRRAATCRPNGGYPGFSVRNASNHNIATWLQGAGYRTIHIGKFLNAYGDEPFDDGRTVPPGWSAWHTRPQRRHRPLLLRLRPQRQRHDRRSLRRPGQLGNARIRRTRRLRLPRRTARRQTLPLPDRRLQPHRHRRAGRDAARTAVLPAARLHRPARRLPPARRARAGDPRLRAVRRRAAAAQLQAGVQRGQRQRQAPLHPRCPLPLLQRTSASTAATTRSRWRRCERSTAE